MLVTQKGNIIFAHCDNVILCRTKLLVNPLGNINNHIRQIQDTSNVDFFCWKSNINLKTMLDGINLPSKPW